MLVAIFILLLIVFFPILSFILGVGILAVIASYWWVILLVIAFAIILKVEIEDLEEPNSPKVTEITQLNSVDKLDQLKQMRDRGLIAPEEYETKKQSILDGL